MFVNYSPSSQINWIYLYFEFSLTFLFQKQRQYKFLGIFLGYQKKKRFGKIGKNHTKFICDLDKNHLLR